MSSISTLYINSQGMLYQKLSSISQLYTVNQMSFISQLYTNSQGLLYQMSFIHSCKLTVRECHTKCCHREFYYTTSHHGILCKNSFRKMLYYKSLWNTTQKAIMDTIKNVRNAALERFPRMVLFALQWTEFHLLTANHLPTKFHLQTIPSDKIPPTDKIPDRIPSTDRIQTKFYLLIEKMTKFQTEFHLLTKFHLVTEFQTEFHLLTELHLLTEFHLLTDFFLCLQV